MSKKSEVGSLSQGGQPAAQVVQAASVAQQIGEGTGSIVADNRKQKAGLQIGRGGK